MGEGKLLFLRYLRLNLISQMSQNCIGASLVLTFRCSHGTMLSQHSLWIPPAYMSKLRALRVIQAEITELISSGSSSAS